MRESAQEIATRHGFGKVSCVSGGDCVSCSSVLGLSPSYGGPSHSSCHFCECPMNLYHDHAAAKAFPLRTQKSIKELAHALGIKFPSEFVPYKCRGCQQEFRTLDEILKWKPPEEDDDVKEYIKSHFGVHPGKGPLLDNVEPIFFLICVLHMRLSLVKTWWKLAISEHLKGWPSYAKCQLVNEILAEDCFTWKQTSSKKRGSVDESGFNDKAFNGAESAHVLKWAAKLVDAVTTSTEPELEAQGLAR